MAKKKKSSKSRGGCVNAAATIRPTTATMKNNTTKKKNTSSTGENDSDVARPSDSSLTETTTATSGRKESSTAMQARRGGGWRPVTVRLGEQEEEPKKRKRSHSYDSYEDVDAATDSTKLDYSKNHYDDPQLMRSEQANAELQAQPGEQVAIFFGLEVMDGNAYQVIRQKQQQEDGNNNKDEAEHKPNTQDDDDDDDDGKKAKKRKNKDNKQDKKQQEGKPKNDNAADEIVQSSNKEKRKKKKNSKKKKLDPSKQDVATSTTSNLDNDSSKKIDTQKDIESAIPAGYCWAGVVLHAQLSYALTRRLEFHQPTPIQAATLPAAILGRRNIVGAAPTGSGKTLAFLLPICQYLLEKQQQDAAIVGASSSSSKPHPQDGKDDTWDEEDGGGRFLQALILAPTRELALQIHGECRKLLPQHKYSEPVVGGLAHVKQVRVLLKRKPPILVGTPGRLWELISSREHGHLKDLSKIKFLVVDEADRMIQQGSFPQLTSIFDTIHFANPMEELDDDGKSRRHQQHQEEEDIDNEDDASDDDDAFLVRLPGVRGEARVEMLSDEILQQIERQRAETKPPTSASTSTNSARTGAATTDKDGSGSDDDDQNQSEGQLAEGAEEEGEEDAESGDIVFLNNNEDDVDLLMPSADDEDLDGDHDNQNVDDYLAGDEPVHRQTFVFSATLTLPSTASFKSKKVTKRLATVTGVDIDGALAEILEKARAKGKTKVVDLTTGKKAKTSKNTKELSSSAAGSQKGQTSSSPSFQLPPGLRLQHIKCTQRHKDSHLYAYVITTEQGAAGPCLVFCNSIAGVRRVSATLQKLGVQVRVLHANMQQRARFKAIESLRKSTSSSPMVVVATDVAARGLDIPSVSTVVHYDTARNIDTFVHRSGRTARGMGEGAVGCSLSLVAPDEDKMHLLVASSIGVRFEDVSMDGRLLAGAQERVNLATQIVDMEDQERQIQRKNQWFREKADEAGLDLDDELIDEGLASSGDKRDRARLRQAQKAQGRLNLLLSQPLQTQRYGKFLSTNSAALATMSRNGKLAPPMNASSSSAGLSGTKSSQPLGSQRGSGGGSERRKKARRR